MTIEKLPSGKYRIKEMRNGTTYRITLDHKPSKSEARDLIQEKTMGFNNNTTFNSAAKTYIKSKENVLSPSTLRSYWTIVNNLDKNFSKMPIDKITLPVLQTLINDLAAKCSPKTVKNYNAFIMSVLLYFGSNIRSPHLPQKKKEIPYIPTEEEVKRILADVKGTKYEVAFILGTFGLRRSEICALTPEDLNGNVLTIDKAKVLNEKNEWVLKDTKTPESTRTIVLPDYVVELIKTKGICDYGPHGIYAALRRSQDRLGIQPFSFHKLRHFFASYMHDLGYTDKQIQEAGGWKTDAVMKTVYQHAMEMDKAKKKMADQLGGLFS